jgi:hypothetical protein
VHAKKPCRKVSGGRAKLAVTVTVYAPSYAPYMEKTQLRNIAASAGAYYFSLWVTPLLAWGFWKLLSRPAHPYRGDFEEKILMPLLIHLPAALVAVAVGALVVWLVESQTPVRWAALPAALFAYFGYTGHHWAIQPSPINCWRRFKRDPLSPVWGRPLSSAASSEHTRAPTVP